MKASNKALRGIAHHLDPIVTVSEAGLTPNVLTELQRALNDHELVKVRLGILDRDNRRSVGDDAARRTGAQMVQRIGKVVVLYKHNPDAKPALSNVVRFGISG